MDEDVVADKVADRLRSRSVTPESTRQKNLNPRANTPIELQASILTPQTGRAKQGDDLRDMYKVMITDVNGDVSLVDSWDLFSSITSDTRISNLDPKMHEYKYVQWAVKCQLMFMQLGSFESASFAQGLALAKSETSLAKNMAFLKNIQTVRQESQHIQVEENKTSRGLFGKVKDAVKGV